MNERDVFIGALRKEDPAVRQAYLKEACAGRPGLCEQVQGLLRLHEGAGSFLEDPAAQSADAGAFDSAFEHPASPECPGAVIGPYKLLEQIGEGGMGTVWMARQTEPVKRVVALKIIQPGLDTRQVIARFEAERQALAMMDHPNIAKVLDTGTTLAGRPYFVMELVKGVPITRYCDEHRLTLRQRLDAVGDPLAVARLQHVLGVSLRDLGDLELAEHVLAKSAQTRSQLLGADHLETVATKHYLAMLYRTQAKYASAERLYKEVLDSRTAKLGQDHPDTLDSRQQLALLYHAQGRFDLAESLCKQVLERRAAVLGADHPDTLTTEHRLAMVHRSRGRFDLAESLCKDVLQRRTAKLGVDDLDTLASKQFLAILYQSQRKHALAEPLYKEVLELRTAKLGTGHPDTFGTRHHLALLYRSMQKFDLSIPLLEETLDLRTAKLGADHPDTLRTRADLGAAYYESGRFADAVAFLTEARGATGGRNPQLPEYTDAALGEAVERLAELYDAAGRPAAAAEWRAEHRKMISERTTGPDE